MPVDASGDTLVPPVGSSEPEATTLARETQNPVIPPATALDSRLLALLSNAPFINGSSLKPNIWSMLENIHRTPSPNSNPTSSPTHVGSEIHPFKGDETATASSPNLYPNQLSNDDTSSIMVYSPLFPTKSDLVELAELVPFDTVSGEVEERDMVVNSTDSGDRVGTQEVAAARAPWTLMWPFSKWHRKDQTQQPSISQTGSSPLDSGGPQPQSAGFTSSQVGTNDVDANSPAIRTVRSQRRSRAWVPSSSKISVQFFWWGYRLYLPPPILEILSDSTFEATNRADAMIGFLSFVFQNIPAYRFPPALQPCLSRLQHLIPHLGPIGSFISWSWIGILSYDAGYGITLTATWLLPVALKPGTWHEGDFPKSPTLNSPIPLPRFRPFSMHSFEPPTPAMSTMTMTDDDTPTSAYATPMSSIISLQPAPDSLDENRMMDLFLASSSTAWLASPSPPQPPHLPLSSPIHYPTTILPNSPNNFCFTPNSPPTTPVAPQFQQPLPSSSTSSVPFTHKPSTTLPSPRIRTPRFSTRMGSFSPNNSGINVIPPHLIMNNNNTTIPPSPPITPIATSTPIPMPPTPIDLPPIPPELPLCPKLVNQLLRGPVLQTVPLPDVG